MLILRDKARPDTVGLTQQKLVEMHWKTLDHPPYNPELSPCDFHMFGPTKEALGGKRFETNDQVETFVRNWLDTRLTSRGFPIRLSRLKPTAANFRRIPNLDFEAFMNIYLDGKLYFSRLNALCCLHEHGVHMDHPCCGCDTLI